MNNVCNICNVDFKYPSLLKRHINKKKGCINTLKNKNTNALIEFKTNIDNTKSISINNIDSIDNDTNKKDHIKGIIKDIIINQNLCYTDILLLFSSIIVQKQNSSNDINNDINKDINKNINKNINKDEKTNIKLYNCKKCNINFASSSSLCNHNTLLRCKGKSDSTRYTNGTSFNDLIGININDSNNNDISITNNITNNNPITNNITNITNNITLNAFGCENLDNITTTQFTSIFKNFNQLHKMLYELGNMVYKNTNNMNFTKNNMNKNIVTYLSRDMEIKQISEREFIKEFENNIKKLCIELFHIHKNDISLGDLIEYMKSFLLFYDTLQEKKINHIELKEQLKSIMDYVFRNENINEVIRKIKVDLENNKELKNQCVKNNNTRHKIQNKIINEYYNSPNEDNKDKINLCIIKETAFKENTKDRQNMLKNSIANRYSKNLENLENLREKNNSNNNEFVAPIKVKFDSETGSIIDDRE